MGEYIEAVLGPQGVLSRRFAGYVPRSGQIAMSRAVDSILSDGGHLLVEAPTGVGKSIAYAVPAVYHAVHNERRAIIATANIALQEQLYRKDLPLLKEILPWDFSFALLKGKNNYLCQDRLLHEEAQGALDLLDDCADSDMLQEILSWSEETKTGDISELSFQPPSRLWQRFSVTSDECKGRDCKHYNDCFAVKARDIAERADLVIVNYHLLFAHLQVQQQCGTSEVIPSFDIAILDEAHKTADIARDFFGIRITAGSIRRATRLLKEINQKSLHESVTEACDGFFDFLALLYNSSEYHVRLRKPDHVSWVTLCRLLWQSVEQYDIAQSAADKDLSAELKTAFNRCSNLATQIRGAMTLADPAGVTFIEENKKGDVALRTKTVKVADILRSSLFSNVESSVLTSATLTVNGSFQHITAEVGVPNPRTLSVESPFDFETQVLLIVPEDMPAPQDADFPEIVAEIFEDILEYAGGRTLGLFTSYRNMDLAFGRVHGRRFNILRQGDKPRTALVDEFRRDITSVLLGTESFWAGVDVPGEALSCVVIDRLPFTSPADPVLDAISETNPRWFQSYSLPRAVIAFKQGFGRLIRSTSDRGVVVVLDERIITKRYGKAFVQSLPRVLKSRRIENIERFLAEVESHQAIATNNSANTQR